MVRKRAEFVVFVYDLISDVSLIRVLNLIITGSFFMELKKILLFFILILLWIFTVVRASDLECPVCRDDWHPLPMQFFSDHNETVEIPAEDISQRAIRWDMFGNFDDCLSTIQKNDNPVRISTTFFKGDQNKMFSKLSAIKKERIVSLDIVLSNYALTEENVNWLLSLTNLEELSIRTKTIPRDLPAKLMRLNKLKYILYVSDGSKETAEIFMEGISCHPTLESLVLCNMTFGDKISWQLPTKTRRIYIDGSLLSLPLIEKVGGTKSIYHIKILNSKFSDKNIKMKKDCLFHPHVRCLEIHDEKLSRHVLDNIEKLPELKLLAIKVMQEDIAFVKSTISDVRNIIRVLLFFDEHNVRNKLWNDFIKELRFNRAIYVDYYSVWFDHILDYEQSILSRKTIDVSILKVQSDIKSNSSGLIKID
jgi:hypothetical protein